MAALSPAVFVCMLKNNPRRRPLAGAEERLCSACGKPMLVGQAILKRPEIRHPDSSFQCLGCADIEGLKLLAPSSAQLSEMARAGYPQKWPLEKKTGQRLTAADVARLRKLGEEVKPRLVPTDSAKTPSEAPIPGTLAQVTEAVTPDVWRRGRQAEIAEKNRKEK